MGELYSNVVILRCGNVASTSFSQRCENNLLTTLYVVLTLCVYWDAVMNATVPFPSMGVSVGE